MTVKPARRRSAHFEGRRGAILRRGAELFATQGFDRTTVQDVMDGFDSTAAAFYYYYADKSELLTEMLDPFMAEAEDRLRELDAKDLPAGTTLRLMLAEHGRMIAADPTMAAVLFEELRTVPEPVRGETRARLAAYTGRLQAIHAAGVQAGELAPIRSDLAIPLVLGMCNQTYRWFRPSGEMTASELGDLAATLAMRALEPKPMDRSVH